MGATVWTPDGDVVGSPAQALRREHFTAGAGQTIFNLVTFQYTPDASSLLVFVNGAVKDVGIDYFETSASRITFAAPLTGGEDILFIGLDTIYPQFATGSAPNNRGAWASGVNYAVNDIVSNAGTWYIAVVNHLSSALFATDLSTKWRVFQGVTAGDLAAPNGSSLINFIAAGAGAVPRSVQSKERDIVGTADFPTLQLALDAAAGIVLWGASAVFAMTTAVTIPSNIELRDMTIQSASGIGQISATNKSNIRFRNVKFTNNGSFSNVPTFSLCDSLFFDGCLFDGTQGANPSSTGLRMQGSTNVVVDDCIFYDFDSSLYLDKSGAVQSDKISVFGSHFEHRILQTGANPTGIYQLFCDHLLVDGCTFIDIRSNSGGVLPNTGYSVYEGDGIAVSLTVTNCISRVSTAHAHVMVQNSNARICKVTENKFFGHAMGPGSLVNQLYQGGAAFGSTVIQDNYAAQGGIFITGGGAAAPLRSAIINYNQIIKLEQNTAAIRLGAQGTNYVSYAKVRGNTTYCTYGGSLNVSECEYAEVEGNFFLNWNTQNKQTANDPVNFPFTSAIYWQQAAIVSSGIIRDNILKNDTNVPGETGFCNYAITAESATAANRIRLYDNIIGPMVIANFVNVLPESGQYTPTLFNTANVTSAVASALNYMRLGQVCNVSGLVTYDPAAAGPTDTVLGISLPFPSNFTGANDVGGTANSSTTAETYAVYADPANDRAVMDGLARDAGSHIVWLNFTYIIK